jgi:hypothetical protein
VFRRIILPLSSGSVKIVSVRIGGYLCFEGTYRPPHHMIAHIAIFHFSESLSEDEDLMINSLTVLKGNNVAHRKPNT